MAASAAVALTLASSPAHAATTRFCNINWGQPGAGCFYSTGDKFKVQDYVKDGRRVVLKWKLINGPRKGRHGECQDKNGAGNGWTWCNYNFPEGSNYAVYFGTVARNGAHGDEIAGGDGGFVTGYVSGLG
ncbi:hypothetical protein ACFW4X_01410 [Streptomyces smyrnaeus]|uniref:hypothetical protein n=1 Tax=Streptomyces smyrnaeus TaxID=1387713 RepID=UPI0036A49FE0